MEYPGVAQGVGRAGWGRPLLPSQFPGSPSKSMQVSCYAQRFLLLYGLKQPLWRIKRREKNEAYLCFD